MIEIIIEEVKMPPPSKRRFQYAPIGSSGGKWVVTDNIIKNSIRYKGGYKEAAIACYNLNKKYYRENPTNQELQVNF